MAEGLLRYFAGDRLEIFSAVNEPATEVNLLAIEIMDKIGIDISHQYPKQIREFLNQEFNLVIKICENTRNIYPIFSKNTTNIH